MLDTRQAEAFWQLFGDSHLFINWPEFRNDAFYRLEVIEVEAGSVIFEPGGAPVFLYLVGSGRVRQSVRHDGAREGPVWLEIEHEPKGYLGQQALFSETYHSRAVAQERSVLFLLSAADLRVAMERSPGLRDSLLREKLASRLRRVPLFRSLADDQIYWLAQVVRESSHPAMIDLPLSDNPGLWIVDWGQVAVTGPAVFYERSDEVRQFTAPVAFNVETKTPSWRLTAGNFFLVTEKPDNTPCSVWTANAPLGTRMFHLPARHVALLAKEFDDVRQLISSPLSIVEILKSVAETERARENLAQRTGDATLDVARQHRLFSGPGMRNEHYQHLAQFCGWEFVPAGQNITTQGSIGHSFVNLRGGKAVVHALDDQGRERPRNTLQQGDYYGETSLLEGKPRDASVRSQRGTGQSQWKSAGGAEVITLDRRDLQYAFAEEAELWRTRPQDGNADIPLARRTVWAAAPKRGYEWLDEGEIVLWNDRAHFFWLLRPELVVLAVYALVLLLTFLAFSALRTSSGSGSFPLDAFLQVALILGIIGLAPTAGLVAINYFLDYYAVTNRRVTRRDRQLLVYDVRSEVLIDMVQDVSTDISFWGALFDYADMTVRTAAKVGVLRLDHVPDPETAKQKIEEGSKGAIAAQRGREKETLRRQVISELKLVLPIPERIRALGENAILPWGPRWLERLQRSWMQSRPEQAELLPGARRGKRMLLPLVASLPPKWRGLFGKMPSPIKPQPGQIIWRKHWINLIQRTGPPILCLLLLLVIYATGGIRGLSGSGLPGTSIPALRLAGLFLFLSGVAWLWYRYTDYHNDIYVVTDDKLIDIEAKPLALSIQQRESNLDRVQNVYAEQKGIWPNLLNYGDVIIMTAAADAGFTFKTVGAPRQVQAIIFQKLDAFRRRQQDQGAKARRQELIEALEIYHELQQERQEVA